MFDDTDREILAGEPPGGFLPTAARVVLRLLGWRIQPGPTAAKYVLIGAPHTSNWDFPFALLCLGALGIEGHWIGKHTLFRWPLEGVMRRLGGIPVDRTTRRNFVDQIVRTFEQHDRLVITIAPEGTRKRTESWKTGFYYIALGAGVPIALGFLDYRRRVGGVGNMIWPSGDIDADLDKIREFYLDKTGKHPERQGRITRRKEPPTEP